jgi:hypothetical protein
MFGLPNSERFKPWKGEGADEVPRGEGGCDASHIMLVDVVSAGEFE